MIETAGNEQVLAYVRVGGKPSDSVLVILNYGGSPADVELGAEARELMRGQGVRRSADRRPNRSRQCNNIACGPVRAHLENETAAMMRQDQAALSAIDSVEHIRHLDKSLG
jgi:hypothetical protein